MTHVTVASRFVAAPWEHSRARLGAAVYTGREDAAAWSPDPAVLAAYQQVWPHRYVIWDPVMQMPEVRQVNPLTGEDESYEHLFLWDRAPVSNEKPSTSIEVADAVSDFLAGRETKEGSGLVECYRPFDMEFVTERIRQRYEWLHLRGQQRQSAVVADRNRAIGREKLKGPGSELAYFYKHEHRWLPAIAAMHAGEHPNLAALERKPQSGGLITVPSPRFREGASCRSFAA